MNRVLLKLTNSGNILGINSPVPEYYYLIFDYDTTTNQITKWYTYNNQQLKTINVENYGKYDNNCFKSDDYPIILNSINNPIDNISSTIKKLKLNCPNISVTYINDTGKTLLFFDEYFYNYTALALDCLTINIDNNIVLELKLDNVQKVIDIFQNGESIYTNNQTDTAKLIYYDQNNLFSYLTGYVNNVHLDETNPQNSYTMTFYIMFGSLMCVIPYPNQQSISYNYTFLNNTCTCFSEGTKILCLNNYQKELKEEYVSVQDLKVGDFVKSYKHGYRKISKILTGSFINNPIEQGASNCMYRMKKTEDNGLIDDLTLTRNHGVLVDKINKEININNLEVIDDLVSIITADSDKFEKVLDANLHKYYHFSLETDGDEDRRFGVWANGLLVETPSNNMMDNATNIKPLDF